MRAARPAWLTQTAVGGLHAAVESTPEDGIALLFAPPRTSNPAPSPEGGGLTKGTISDHVRLAVRRLRIERGILVREVAERTGIPLGSYSCLEAGNYKINTDNLFRILHVLGASIDQVWPAAPGKNGPVLEVSDEYVRKVLARARKRNPVLPSVQDAVDVVCRVYGVTLEELSSPSRVRRLAEARAVASMLIEGQPHLSKSQLGHVVQRDPSTLEHCANRLRKRLPEDRQLQARIEEARNLFSRKPPPNGNPQEHRGSMS